MDRILPAANILAGLIGIVCCIHVWVKMFRRGERDRGIISRIVPPLIGFLLSRPPFCVVGLLLTWFRDVWKRTEWDLHKVMTVWSMCLFVSFLVYGEGTSAWGLR
jgi:hypothetical protein